MTTNFDKYIFISDIHARVDDLINLTILAEKFKNQNVQYIFVGDFLDGVEIPLGFAPRTLDFVYNFSQKHPTQIVKGNHDLMFLEVLSGNQSAYNQWLENDGGNTLSSFNLPGGKNELITLFKTEKEYLADFIESQPLTYETDSFIVVHAGFDWNVPFDQQSQHDLTNLRKEYFYEKPVDVDNPKIHKNLLNKIIISGHTPTYFLNDNKKSPIMILQASPEDKPRYLIDGGSNYGLDGAINALILNQDGQFIAGDRLEILANTNGIEKKNNYKGRRY